MNTDIDNIDDSDSGDSGEGRGGRDKTDRKLFLARGHLVQEELAQGEKTFGEIDWSRRETEPPPEEEIENPSYTEEEKLAMANDDVIEQHEWLACQQFDGRDPKRDPRIPSTEDLINYADNHPQAQLVLNPQLRLALENAKRNKLSATPTLKPSGM